ENPCKRSTASACPRRCATSTLKPGIRYRPYAIAGRGARQAPSLARVCWTGRLCGLFEIAE
ncbi:MAG: hypothetical protein VX739_03835, partial [Planctomycetota bacterium]|nr:hypothetical protein [Planctomycetota bacterium]